MDDHSTSIRCNLIMAHFWPMWCVKDPSDHGGLAAARWTSAWLECSWGMGLTGITLDMGSGRCCRCSNVAWWIEALAGGPALQGRNALFHPCTSQTMVILQMGLKIQLITGVLRATFQSIVCLENKTLYFIQWFKKSFISSSFSRLKWPELERSWTIFSCHPHLNCCWFRLRNIAADRNGALALQSAGGGKRAVLGGTTAVPKAVKGVYPYMCVYIYTHTHIIICI